MLSFILIFNIVFFTEGAIYQPRQGARFQIQLQMDDIHPFDYSMRADLYDVDLWEVTAHDISAIHAKGAKVSCYFSAGSFEDYRPDAHLFHSSDIGNKMQGWDEKWLDIRSSNVRQIMAKRLDLAKNKHCDAVDADNVDGHQTGNANIGFSFNDQLVYNKWLADQAHARGLAIGLKNDLDQINELHAYFDFAINEQCHVYNECHLYQPMLSAGKAVFNLEYTDSNHVSTHDQTKCTSQHLQGMSTQFKHLTLDAWVWHCPGQ